MPVTLFTNEVEPRPWAKDRVESATALLQGACRDQRHACDHVIQSSFPDDLFNDTIHITPSKNGFALTLVEAYSGHNHITLRPEDVWFAILSQLNYFINAHAEELRHLFVAHEGSKQLTVTENGPSIYHVDVGAMATRMSDLIQKNVVDPDLRAWIMPAWTTTTQDDQVVAAVMMMGCLQKYFTYHFDVRCGIPSVTLLGEVEDWKDMLQRLDRLERLGEEPAHFGELLKPVLRRFVASFEDPTGPEVLSFWNRAVDRYTGSGMDHCTGWVTAFCYWDSEGKKLGKAPWGNALNLDGAEYRQVGTNSIPAGYSSVPVTVDDHGVEFPTTMVAGLVGIRARPVNNQQTAGNLKVTAETPEKEPLTVLFNSSSGTKDPQAPPNLYALQPVSGWWMFKNKETPQEDRNSNSRRRFMDELDDDDW